MSEEKKYKGLRSPFDTDDMTNVTDKFDIEVYRTVDPDFQDEETIILRIRGKRGEVDMGYNTGTMMSKKLVKYLDCIEEAESNDS